MILRKGRIARARQSQTRKALGRAAPRRMEADLAYMDILALATVFDAVAEGVTPGQMAEVRGQLPDDLKPLFTAEA